MSRIKLDGNEMMGYAKCYKEACDLICQGQQAIERANTDMQAVWEGGAFTGYLQQYQQVLKPAIENYQDVMQSCYSQLENYASVMQQRDNDDKAAFQKSIQM